jgi:hypothetical protein
MAKLPPNAMRLSYAAECECTQVEFYLDNGRPQLQPRVRQHRTGRQSTRNAIVAERSGKSRCSKRGQLYTCVLGPTESISETRSIGASIGGDGLGA